MIATDETARDAEIARRLAIAVAEYPRRAAQLTDWTIDGLELAYEITTVDAFWDGGPRDGDWRALMATDS
ncbi:MAG TPA: hypothetical protein VK453_25850 [Micromonosporaceae bacterium]|nr:hypothetical protein [Micromonosporaceae bacterium]